MLRHYFSIIFVSLFRVGCSVNTPSISQSKRDALSHLLVSLDSDIPQSEAEQLSRDIFYKTEQLTEEFKMASPPQFHNFLVTVGVKEKGLCYHWSDTLYLYLTAKGYASFEFHLMGANVGEYFYEHNALVVIAKDGKIEEGVIIDPWRDSGELYCSKVKDDLKYEWQHRPKRGCP